MADEADPTDQLTPSDLIGIAQRMLGEIHGYLNQPSASIDPGVVMAGLNRVAYFITKLPQASVGAPSDRPSPEQRAN